MDLQVFKREQAQVGIVAGYKGMKATSVGSIGLRDGGLQDPMGLGSQSRVGR